MYCKINLVQLKYVKDFILKSVYKFSVTNFSYNAWNFFIFE